jgi:hypothetical protein
MTYDYQPTIDGTLFNLSTPSADEVSIAQIAHGLAGIRRFAGTGEITVAQHSVDVSRIIEKSNVPEITTDLLMAALLHDAHEAYIGDITRAVARIVGQEKVDQLKDRVQRAVHDHFNLPVWPTPVEQRIIRRADVMVGTAEALYEFPQHPNHWLGYYYELEGEEAPEPPNWTDITWGRQPMTTAEAEFYFLNRYGELRWHGKSG